GPSTARRGRAHVRVTRGGREFQLWANGLGRCVVLGMGLLRTIGRQPSAVAAPLRLLPSDTGQSLRRSPLHGDHGWRQWSLRIRERYGVVLGLGRLRRARDAVAQWASEQLSDPDAGRTVF